MGRGHYYRWNTKISTSDLLCVRLADFKKHKCFTPGRWYIWQWSRNGEEVASVRFVIADSFIMIEYVMKDSEDNKLTVNKTIPLTLISCNFGGHRKLFRCGCGKKVATMFIRGQTIACRHCFNAVYPSQREDAIDRLWRKIDKLEAKLKNDQYSRPKGMHIKTYERIKDEWINAHIKKDKLFNLACARFLSQNDWKKF